MIDFCGSFDSVIILSKALFCVLVLQLEQLAFYSKAKRWDGPRKRKRKKGLGGGVYNENRRENNNNYFR